MKIKNIRKLVVKYLKKLKSIKVAKSIIIFNHLTIYFKMFVRKKLCLTNYTFRQKINKKNKKKKLGKKKLMKYKKYKKCNLAKAKDQLIMKTCI